MQTRNFHRGHGRSHGHTAPRRFGARGQGGFNRGRGGRKNFSGDNIDISRFINKKTVVEEKVEEYVPEHAFADFKLDERLKKNIADKGYVTPTPIQDRTIPHALLGQDVIGIANTGTGKTAAFLIPLINKVLTNWDENVLIVAPTRELANQIDEEFKGFARGLGLHSAICVGGASMGRQIGALSRGPQFVIGTPGRLKDLIEQKKLSLERCGTIVLDEADRMLDMGFIHDMRFLMSLMPNERHTLFFSATMSKEISALTHQFLKNPVTVSVKTRETSQNVEQDIVKVGGGNKVEILNDLLQAPEFTKVLVFSRTKHGAEKLARELDRRGIRSESIHGNKSQSQRERALNAFKTHKVRVLVATDVAARGLDIADVSHVINFDVPSTYEDYVHRIGRTGRGEKRGKALTFV